MPSARGSKQEGVDAYFGVRRENTRYLAGLELGDGEEKVAGYSGQFLVSARRGRRAGRLALHACRSASSARTRASSDVYNDFSSRWPELLARAIGGDAERRRGRGRLRQPRDVAEARRRGAGR